MKGTELARVYRMMYRIRLEKENFKFSCSHFTILSEGAAERLHGHNYYVFAELELERLDPTLGMAFDFNEIKPIIRELTQSLDELVLLPERSPFLKIESARNSEGTESITATFGRKRYVLPSEDVRILQGAANITSEELSKWLALEFLARLPRKDVVRTISIGVEETRGQSVICTLEVPR